MDKATDYGVRFLAVLLAIGGMVGVGLSFYLGYLSLQQHWVFLFVVGFFVVVFAWTLITGFRLWRGDERGVKWAKILFAAQIPVLTVPGLNYEYYAGLSMKLLAGEVKEHFALGLGASGTLYLDTRITDWIYGVNIFAVIALTYLLYRPRSGASLRGGAAV